MSTSTIPAFLDALVDALAVLPSLAGVSVLSGLDTFAPTPEWIGLGGEVEISEEPAAMAGARLESYVVSGYLHATKPGAGETVIRDARSRAFALLAAIETYLNDNPTVSGTVLDADLVPTRSRNDIVPDGRQCEIEFEIRVRAVKNP